MLVLLHGRAEAADPRLGVRAWRDRYGLEEAFARLGSPPVSLPAADAHLMESERLAGINASLRRDPFAAFVVLCPFTPNPNLGDGPERALDEYADWVEQRLLPAARLRAGLAANDPVGLDGCSMGGRVATEIFIRKPSLFRTFGVTQPAFGAFRSERYARLMAGEGRSDGNRARIHLQTTVGDPYRTAVEELSQELERRGRAHDASVLPGEHGQRWLRASGTLHLVWWHHRALTQADSGA
jgi:hypothetical protein